jgi:AhpD family alkylhydroperoxidase
MRTVFDTLAHTKPTVASKPVTDAASAYKDIELTLGSVPSFFRAFPAAAIAPAWLEMKTVQMNPATALSGKAKELIGLAVAAQVPCKYCVYFHTAAARLNGATEQEIQEAVAMASMTRFWSTILNGTMQDELQVKREVDRIVANERRAAKQAAR